MWHCVAATKVVLGLVGLTCVLASGLMPAYSLRGSQGPFYSGGPTGGADCDLGVWRTKCTWWINENDLGGRAGGWPDMATYDVPLLQRAWIAPVMEAVYTTVLVLGVTTMVWQLAAAREGACLQAKAHGWHYCEWALHLFTALLGVVYPVFVILYGTNFWVAYENYRGYTVNVLASADNFYLHVKPGLVMACAGAISLIASLVLRCIEACLTKSAPLKTVAEIPDESQPVVGREVNAAVYHTCA